jgi:hypothetical protein
LSPRLVSSGALARSPREACLGRAGWRGVMGAGTQHVREWSNDFSLLTLRVRDFILLLDIFACMEKIALAYFGKQLLTY